MNPGARRAEYDACHLDHYRELEQKVKNPSRPVNCGIQTYRTCTIDDKKRNRQQHFKGNPGRKKTKLLPALFPNENEQQADIHDETECPNHILDNCYIHAALRLFSPIGSKNREVRRYYFPRGAGFVPPWTTDSEPDAKAVLELGGGFVPPWIT
jgi:hypothetical protein